MMQHTKNQVNELEQHTLQVMHPFTI